MAYDAKAVANFFLDLAESTRTSLTPMKLQKLIYFGHAWNLALRKEPLIADAVEAWQYGPVVPSVYHEFKSFGSGAINRRATTFDLDDFEFVTPTIPDNDKMTAELLRHVWSSYGRMSAVQLSNLTHEKDSPWDVARQGKADQKAVLIDDSMIQSYFESLATSTAVSSTEPVAQQG